MGSKLKIAEEHEKAIAAAQETISELEATNERIKKDIAVSGLTDMQVRYIEEHSSDIEKNIRPEFKLDWNKIKFLMLLGSGTFGDCYKGSIGMLEVAVSWVGGGVGWGEVGKVGGRGMRRGAATCKELQGQHAKD